jgi:hypothetical protein
MSSEKRYGREWRAAPGITSAVGLSILPDNIPQRILERPRSDVQIVSFLLQGLPLHLLRHAISGNSGMSRGTGSADEAGLGSDQTDELKLQANRRDIPLEIGLRRALSAPQKIRLRSAETMFLGQEGDWVTDPYTSRQCSNLSRAALGVTEFFSQHLEMSGKVWCHATLIRHGCRGFRG